MCVCVYVCEPSTNTHTRTHAHTHTHTYTHVHTRTHTHTYTHTPRCKKRCTSTFWQATQCRRHYSQQSIARPRSAEPWPSRSMVTPIILFPTTLACLRGRGLHRRMVVGKGVGMERRGRVGSRSGCGETLLQCTRPLLLRRPKRSACACVWHAADGSRRRSRVSVASVCIFCVDCSCA
jgi:hypothetical protein